MKIKLANLFGLLFFTSVLFGQDNPVTWSFESEQLGNNEFNIIFTADVKDGWYVYSQFLEDGGPIPTSFNFSDNEAVQMIGQVTESGDSKKEGFDEIFGMQLIKYGDKVTFIQKVKSEQPGQILSGYLTYMTCNDHSCLPPRDIDFEVELK